MPSTFEGAFAVVQSLAKDFEANKAHFLSPAYNETEVRKDFIDKFLIALGWDVNHDHQKNPFEQEVKVERGVSMHGSQRRADYAFYKDKNFYGNKCESLDRQIDALVYQLHGLTGDEIKTVEGAGK